MPSISASPGPGLSGIRVVDFGHHIAGPLAALLLAEAGADVIRIDSPTAAHRLGPVDAWVNSSKRRITLDLKSAADLEVARDLVTSADVVIENFRPGVMDRLGLGPMIRCEADPRLIYCSIPGFASDDESASVQAWEGVIQAAVAGYCPLTQHWDPAGRNRVRLDDPSAPLYTPITTASTFGALMGAISVLVALLARERTGRGQRIEVPLAETFAEAYSTMLTGRVFESAVVDASLMLREMTYPCADGRLIDLAPQPKFVIPLLTAAGVAEDWQREGLIDIGARTFSPDRERIEQRFNELTQSQTAAWWDDLAARAELPLSMVRTPQEWMDTEQAEQSGAAVDIDDPLFGRLRRPGRGFDLANAPVPTARHLPDVDRADLLAELQALTPRSSSQPAVPVSSDSALYGYQVLEFSQAVAGPTAARILADFGADVVKVGSPVPAVTDGIVGQLHRGKRTIIVDALNASAGQRLMSDLLRGADVVVTNFSPGSQARYGIDAVRALAVNPQLVHCTISAYGATGPWAHRRGYENQCNAATGMSSRYGSRFGWTLYQPTPVTDAATGLLGAYAALVGLVERFRTGVGQAVGASLAQAATVHQGALLIAEQASPEDPPDADRNAHGVTAIYRMYRASDAWIFLSAQLPDLTGVLRATGIDDTRDLDSWRDPGGPLARRLVDCFAKKASDEWVAALGSLGVTAHRVRTIDETTDYLRGRGVVYDAEGPGGVEVPRPGMGRWLSETPPRVGPDPGPVGSQGHEIFRELGLSDPEIAELASEGVILLPGDLPEVARWS